MNTILRICLLGLLLMVASTLSVSAQIKESKKKTTTTEQRTDPPAEATNPNETDNKPRATTAKKTSSKKTDKYFDESGGFKHRLWYGGNMNLNFGGGNNYSLFSVGVTPMVGYKIIGGLSAGPRFGVTFTNYKAISSTANNDVKSVGLFQYTLAGFTRYKAFKNFFLHAEYEYQSVQYPEINNGVILVDVNGKPLKSRYNFTNYYGGVGYNSGGVLGYEIMLLYNFAIPKNSLDNPIGLRFGFTYKF